MTKKRTVRERANKYAKLKGYSETYDAASGRWFIGSEWQAAMEAYIAGYRAGRRKRA